MPKPPTGEVDLEDVEALFDKDGDLRDEVQDKDDESEEPAEDESQEENGDEQEDAEEEAEEESEDDESEEEEEAELSWDALEDPRYQEAFNKAQQDAERWQKAHSKLQSQLTRESNARKEEDSNLSEMREYANAAREWNAILEKHPELQRVIEKELAKLQNPFRDDDLPDYLKGDPALKFVRERYEPIIRGLEQKLKAAEAKVGKVDSWEAKEQETRNRQRLDNLLSDAATQFKAMFGKDITDEERNQVLQYMVENKYYESGKTAAFHVFNGQYEKTLKGKATSDVRAKAKKFPARNKSVNAARVDKSPKHASSPEEAVAMALAEQGFE